MTKRTERGQRRQAENGAGPTLAHLVEPMLTGMATTRHDLLAWVHAHGLAALDELFGAEAVGPGRAQGPASTAAHPSSLGDGGDGAHLRRAARGHVQPERHEAAVAGLDRYLTTKVQSDATQPQPEREVSRN
jgi:hypothetical protein